MLCLPINMDYNFSILKGSIVYRKSKFTPYYICVCVKISLKDCSIGRGLVIVCISFK